MRYSLPTPSQLRRHGDSLGIEMNDAYIAEVLDYVAPMAALYDLVESLPDDLPPVKYLRTPGHRPDPAENPLGAWYVKTSLKGSARGHLKGRTVALKDTICLAGIPMMNGASVLEGYVPEVDATVATRLLDAGAEIVGKTVCEYFSASGGCMTAATGPVINPRKPGFSAGGSSSGSAAVVANGEVDMAMGGDQAGSIRVPAAYCGVVGIKPTFGLVPYTGIMGLDPTFDYVGPLTRTVADNALFLEVLAGPDGCDSRQRGVHADRYLLDLDAGIGGLRVGIVDEGFDMPMSEPEVDRGVRQATTALAKLGAEVESVSIPWHAYGGAFWAVASFESSYHTYVYGGGMFTEGLSVPSLVRAMNAAAARMDEFADTVKVSLLLGRHALQSCAGGFYGKTQNLRRRLRAAYDDAFEHYDLLVMPTAPNRAPRVPGPDAKLAELLDHCWNMAQNTAPFDLTGHPALSIPCAVSDGRPIGMQIVGRHGDEATIYRLAHAFERVSEWQHTIIQSGKG